MLTLGIHDGHTSTACLFEDGAVIACISEERITREKEWTGFPQQAILKCLEITGKTIEQIDAVGFCSLMPQIGQSGYHNPGWHKRAFSYAARVLPRSLLQSDKNVARVLRISKTLFKARHDRLLRDLKSLGIDPAKAKFYEHHFLHAATSYYLSWFRDRKTLVVTLDGSGDSTCATLNIGEHGQLTRIAEIFNYNSICELYTRVTQYLGMKPMSHEYKVMGMAPYATNYGKDDVRNVFRSYFKVDPNNPLRFINTSGAWKWQMPVRLAKDLKGSRFDILCGAVQELFEDVVVQWIQNAIRHTGIGNVAVSGGGFMNVKLNYRISELPEVESLFIFPSCGDESNPIGAAMQAAIDNGYSPSDIKPLGMVYWGPQYTNADVQQAIATKLNGQGFKIEKHEDINQKIAEKVAQEKVVGRMVGRMEWGARSLGNRSIVADPRKSQIIHKINRAIKMRDFWMPFAPAILIEYREKYLKLREDYPCPFMTIAPDTKPAAWDVIPAGLHPFDRSARCQILDPQNHPSFYDLVSKFERLTGVGGVLNTSFNLHGDAVVMTPEDAIHTFLNSDLDVLQMENYLVEK
jgi:carbamoyltransferase